MSKLLRASGTARVCWRLQHKAPQTRPWRTGDHVHNYTVASVLDVSEMDLTAIHLRHKSGAEHLHVSKKDQDNVFGVAFRTTPHDSTGVPHILEHVSLCGSRNYPVRDPFFKMLNRSLSTFMNAFTANDWTMYPFSTQNPTDFSNLLHVYLDAVFHPLIRKSDFLQEGWRLETDPTPQLKGVVYNEMKGVFSDPHQVYAEAALNNLHPKGTYSFVSGGHPDHIPELTWKQLRDFHAHHYLPSNARFFTYGNLPLEDHLRTIDDHLTPLKHPPYPTAVLPQQRWASPRKATVHCPIDPLSPNPQSSMISTNYLLCDVTNIQASFELSFLSTLLIGGPHSPFYRGLLEKGLGAEYTSGTGFSREARDTCFSVGLQRVEREKVDEVVEAMEEIVDGVVEKGFREEQVNAILHRIELSLKHQSDQFGLRLLLDIIPAWNHGAEPTHLLQVTRYVDELKRRLSQDATYLQELTRKYLKDNPHQLLLTSIADPDYAVKQQQLEQQLVDRLVAAESRKIETTKEADAVQEEGAEDCLPCLRVDEVGRSHERVAVVNTKVGGMTVYTCPQATNGVTYIRMIIDSSHLPAHLTSYLPLFCHLITSMGAGELDYRGQSEAVELCTGGLNATPLLTPHPSHSDLLQASILLSSHCLDRNVPQMMQLWTDIFVALNLSDANRFGVLLSSLAADSAAVLSQNGHRFAMLRSRSSLNALSQLQEEMDGVTQMTTIKQMLSSPREELLATMKQLSEALLLASSRLVRSSIHCQPASIEDGLEALSDLHRQVIKFGVGEDGVGEDVVFASRPQPPVFANSHLHVPFQVNYIGRSFLATPFTHADHAPLKLLSSILTSKYLHREVREKGGAYGGGSAASSNTFQFYSYRDPNVSTTLNAFSASIQWACEGGFKDSDLEEAKLAVFSQVDKPIPPGSKALRYFLQGVSEDQWGAFREGLFKADRGDIERVATQYLTKPSSTTLIGPTDQPATLKWEQCTSL